MPSIQRYLTKTLAAAQLLFLVALGATLYFAIHAHLVEELDHSLAVRLEAMAPLVELEDGKIEIEDLGPLGRRFSATRHEPDYFELRDADGAIWAKSDSLASQDLPFHPATANQRPTFTNHKNDHGRTLRLATQRFTIKNKQDTRDIYLSYAVERAETDEFLEWFAALYTLLSLLAIALLSLASRAALRRGLQPLAQLSQHAAALETSDLTLPFPSEKMPQELTHISDTLNTLMQRIHQTLSREKQLTQDIAHDLRTPVAELRAIAQSTLDYPSTDTETRHALQETLTIAGEMAQLIETLLALAKADHAQLTTHKQAIDLHALFTAALQPSLTQLKTRQITYLSLNDSPLTITYDPSLLAAIVRNLVDNAVQYTPDHSDITLDCCHDATTFTARLSNPAPTLQPADLPHLFQRHWRKDPSRHASNHTGLGLALAQAYAQAQGLQLTATLSPQKALTLTLTGPLT